MLLDDRSVGGVLVCTLLAVKRGRGTRIGLLDLKRHVGHGGAGGVIVLEDGKRTLVHVSVTEANRLPSRRRHVGGVRGGQHLHRGARVDVVLRPTVGVVGGIGIAHLVPGKVVPAIGVQVVVVFLHCVEAVLARIDLPGVGVRCLVIAGVAVAPVGGVGVVQVGVGNEEQLVVGHVGRGAADRGLMRHVDVEVLVFIKLVERAVATCRFKGLERIGFALKGFAYHQASLLGHQHAVDVPAVGGVVLNHVPTHGEV